MSFEKGAYRLVTKEGKELEVPATEIDLVRFHETLPMPLTPPAPGDEVLRRRWREEAARLERQMRKLKKEGRLGEFMEKEEEALKRLKDARDAMLHLPKLRQAAIEEWGPGSPQVQSRVKDAIRGIEDPVVRRQVTLGAIGRGWLRRTDGPRWRRPLRER